jgi:hypothetical protein
VICCHRCTLTLDLGAFWTTWKGWPISIGWQDGVTNRTLLSKLRYYRGFMEPLSIAQCRKLIGQPQGTELSEEEVAQLRDMLYSLAEVIADAFIDVNNIDQRLFEPPGDAVDILQNNVADLIGKSTEEGVAQ